MVRQAGAYPDFCNEATTSIHGMLVHRRVIPSIKVAQENMILISWFAGTYLYAWAERNTVRLKFLVKKTTQCFRTELEPRPLDPRPAH